MSFAFLWRKIGNARHYIQKLAVSIQTIELGDVIGRDCVVGGYQFVAKC